MGDLISRKDAIALVDRSIVPTGDAVYDNAREDERESIKDDLMSLPSASDSRQRGEWIYLYGSIGSYMTMSCPFCGVTFNNVAEWEYNFCPNCGAGMRGEEDADE